MKEFPLTLKGSRVELRTVEPSFENAEKIFEVIKRNKAHLLPWMTWAAAEKAEDSFVFLEGIKAGREKKTKYDYGIFVDDEYVGNMGIFGINEENRSAEIGYWICKSKEGKGYVSEALKLLENEAFSNEGFNRIVIQCDVRNIKSAQVAERNGYTREATFRENAYSKYEDILRSTHVYAKIRSDLK